MATFVGEYNFPETENQNDTGTTLTLATAALEDTQAIAAGDLVYMFATFRATTGTMSITTTGGQTWTEHINAIDGFLFGVWSCIFDGTWDADPVITYSGSASPRILRANAWTDHDGWSIAPTNDGDPGGGDQTFAFDTNNDGDVAILGGGQSDNNTGTVDNGFTAPPGSGNMYHRSAGGADFSTGLAVKEIATAGPIGTTTFDWAANESLGIEWHAAIKPAAAGQTENYGIAAETDAALALAAEKLETYGLASESDAAQAFLADRRHLYDIAAETDAGLAFVHSKLAPYGVAAETDSALALAVSKLVEYGIAGETDLALVFTGELGGGGQTEQYGVASESDAALAFVHSKEAFYGLATESDAALGLSAEKFTTYGVAAETSAALALAVSRLASYGVATEADAALAFAVAKLVEYGIASETDEGLAFTADVGATTATYGLAVEDDEALALVASKLAEYGIAIETDAARHLVVTVQYVAGVFGAAEETDRAMPFDSYTARITEAFEVARGDFGLGVNRRRKRYTKGEGRVTR